MTRPIVCDVCGKTITHDMRSTPYVDYYILSMKESDYSLCNNVYDRDFPLKADVCMDCMERIFSMDDKLKGKRDE